MPTLQDSEQRASLSLQITAASDLKIVASGIRLFPRQLDSGRVVHSFVLNKPSAPFLYAFAAGQFDETSILDNNLKLTAMGPPGTDLSKALASAAQALGFLVDHTGVAYSGHEYVQVFVQGEAAQEAAGFSIISADSLDDIRRNPQEDWVFSHELAHQWFAWLIPCADFSDFWLNEGFATFFVAAIKEQRWGRGAYERERSLWHERSSKVHASGRDAPVSLSRPGGMVQRVPRDSELQARGVTYSRGALVLDKLRTELGDDVFWNSIRRYVRDNAAKSGVRTEDLRAAFEVSSGRDLRAFFDTWVYSSAPDL
jgi:aminopeptidase N